MLSSLWGNSFEPLESTPDSPVQLTEKDLQEWEQAGTRLKRDVEEGIDETVSLWVQILENPSKEYLEAVQDELERIQAGRPTTYLYTLADDLDLSEKAQEIERLDVEAKMEQEAKLDVKFEAFLDQMAMPPEARATLDNPSNPADPRSPTFRQLLRTSWEDMYGSKGVLGGLENEFDALNNFDLGMGRSLEPDQNIDDILASPDYKPGRIPLMTIHLLRDQLRARIDSLSTSSSSNLLPPEDPLDVQILPKISRSVSDDYLNFFQRSVQIDLRARRLVQRVLSILYRIPAPPDSATDAGRALISPSMLLASPADFPHFVKKLDWTLTRCSERFLSAHRFALVAFQPETGLVAIKRLEREILAAEEAAAQGAKHSGDEL
ncbi:uncharacterized protein JCM15063_002645 [Sporobolomyces koalae]|uniref:uncharacterized protein n=1 Tax=Sporobolomyces koalae TaxID=500713 RepID=UPI00317C07BF